MTSPVRYCLVTCHQGAEVAVKADLGAQGWRLAFSRPGFVTFKKDATAGEAVSLPRGTFARTSAWSLGSIATFDSAELSAAIVDQLREGGSELPFSCLHLWARDRLPAGERGFEPGLEPLTEALSEDVGARLHRAGVIASPHANPILQESETALDVVMVDAGKWMLGWHRAESFLPTRWPGGFPPLDFSRDIVSRAYFKAAEAFLWSGLPIRPGDLAVEIGSAPGGACQRMLELGLRVLGVDPADMDPRVADHPSFKHLRARGGDVKRAEYAGAKWLLVDSNVRPDKTLVTVANIVSHRSVGIEGMLLTMKIGRYDQADRIPGWCQTIRSWGFTKLSVRQLATGRCEVCIAASR